jgi:hypothetical protein
LAALVLIKSQEVSSLPLPLVADRAGVSCGGPAGRKR